MNKQEFYKRLIDSRLIESIPPYKEPKSSIYLGIVNSFLGWIGALFTLALTILLFSNIFQVFGILLLGIIISFVGFYIIKDDQKKSAFMQNYSLAFVTIGHMLVVFSIFRIIKPYGSMEITIFFLSLVPLHIVYGYFIANKLFRIYISLNLYITLLIVTSQLHLLWLFSGITLLSITYAMIKSIDSYKYREIYESIAYGGIATLLYYIWVDNNLHIYRVLDTAKDSDFYMMLNSTALSIAFIVTFYMLFFNKIKTDSKRYVFIAITILLSIVGYYINGFAISLAILLTAFMVGDSYIIAVGFISMVLFIIKWYYNLDTTLLNKSIMLIISGIVLLVTRSIIIKFWGVEDEKE